jgi:predicted  nucleic acid-binding Zn-ribbon protein
MSAALGLFRLQQIDTRLSQVESRLSILQAALDNDARLRDSLDTVDALQSHQDGLEADLRAAEHEAQAQKVKLDQAEASLYGGTVRNPKELQDLQNDVASLKRHLAVLEERQLESMLAAENGQLALARARAQLEVIEAQLGDEHRDLISERTSLLHDHSRLDSERQAAVSALAAEILAMYERLRQERRGVAVAEVADGGCAACGTTLTPAQQQSARQAAQLVNCPSCGRILFAP